MRAHDLIVGPAAAEAEEKTGGNRRAAARSRGVADCRSSCWKVAGPRRANSPGQSRRIGESRELFVATVLGTLARAQGEAAMAWRIVAQQLPAGLATPPGGAIFADALALIELAVGLALDANDLPTMRSWLEAYDRWLAWGRASTGTWERELAWARYVRAIGDLERARERGEAALARATSPRQPLGLLASERFLGDLAAATGQFESPSLASIRRSPWRMSAPRPTSGH